MVGIYKSLTDTCNKMVAAGDTANDIPECQNAEEKNVRHLHFYH
jgi:hypothetical protein